MLKIFQQNPVGSSYLREFFEGFLLNLKEKKSINHIVTHHLYQEVIEDIFSN